MTLDSRQEINRRLAEMGEPPLGEADLVQSRFVEESTDVSTEGDEKKIALVEPPGYLRSHLFFMNGREVIVDMQLADLVAAVRDFNADPSRDFLELPHIELVGGDQQGNGGVVLATPTHFSRKALELVQSMGVTYARRVPGEEKSGGKGKVAVIRGGEADQVLVNLNRMQRRALLRSDR
jgi:hypothetical protein